MTRLSRRDRAACVLALELARSRLTSAVQLADVLVQGSSHGFAQDVGNAFAMALGGWNQDEHDHLYLRADFNTKRAARVRLALYLRAVLRADAGDYGPVSYGVCYTFRRWCGSERSPDPGGDYRCGNCGQAYEVHSPRRITPLWERAGRHG